MVRKECIFPFQGWIVVTRDPSLHKTVEPVRKPIDTIGTKQVKVVQMVPVYVHGFGGNLRSFLGGRILADGLERYRTTEKKQHTTSGTGPTVGDQRFSYLCNHDPIVSVRLADFGPAWNGTNLEPQQPHCEIEQASFHLRGVKSEKQVTIRRP